MKKRILAPVAVVALTVGAVAAGFATSGAQAADTQVGTPLWLGSKPVYLDSAEAVADWNRKITVEQSKLGSGVHLPKEAPGIRTQSRTPEGDPILHEIGLVDSLVAQTVRCSKITSWLEDPNLTMDRANMLADADFKVFAQKEIMAKLADLEGYRQVVRDGAAHDGVTPIEAEITYICGDLTAR